MSRIAYNEELFQYINKSDEQIIEIKRRSLQEWPPEIGVDAELAKWIEKELPKIKSQVAEITAAKVLYDASCAAFISSLPKYNPEVEIPDLTIKEQRVWLNRENDDLLTALDDRYKTLRISEERTEFYFRLMERNIQTGLPHKNLDSIFNISTEKTLVVDFENLNYPIRNNRDVLNYEESGFILNQFKNSLAFLLNYVLNENYSKLIVVTKMDIFDLFEDVFKDKSDEHFIEYESRLAQPSNGRTSEQKVYYHLTNTIQEIKNRIKENTLSIQVVKVYNNFPADSRYGDDEEFIKLVKSFDDCTLVYLVDRLRQGPAEYKLISNDLRMFDDFNNERKIVLPFIMEVHELRFNVDECLEFSGRPFDASTMKNEIKFHLLSTNLINTLTDPFFKKDIDPSLYKPNQICSLYPVCQRDPYQFLYPLLDRYYFVVGNDSNHILKANIGDRGNPSKYKAFFNISKDELLKRYTKFGFASRSVFNDAIDVFPDIPGRPFIKGKHYLPARPARYGRDGTLITPAYKERLATPDQPAIPPTPGRQYYYEKYLKYKSKYLALKNKLL